MTFFTGTRSRSGYALVALLLVAALAVMAAGTAVTVALAESGIMAADRRSGTAMAVAEAGVAGALERLTWGLAGGMPAMEPEVFECSLEGAHCRVTVVRRVPRLGEAAWPRHYSVMAEASCDRARASAEVEAALSVDRLPRGLCVQETLLCDGTLTICGSGVYAGGDVHGRELIDLRPSTEPTGQLEALDHAHPELYALAGVHAGGFIYSDGEEVHARNRASKHDGDACTGTAPPGWLTEPPSVPMMAALASRQSAPGGSLHQGTLNVATLGMPRQLPPGGLIVVIAAEAQPLTIVGLRAAPPAEDQLTLVVLGDAVLADPDGVHNGVAFTGELIVSGHLAVEAPTAITGSLFAGSLHVLAPTVLELSPDWRESPPPGARYAWTENIE